MGSEELVWYCKASVSLRGLIGAFSYKTGVRELIYVSGSFGSCAYALWIKRVRQTPEKIFRTQVLVHRGFELYAFRTKALKQYAKELSRIATAKKIPVEWASPDQRCRAAIKAARKLSAVKPHRIFSEAHLLIFKWHSRSCGFDFRRFAL